MVIGFEEELALELLGPESQAVKHLGQVVGSNSLRYRLGRITKLTGRDPRKLTDLLELIAATHVVSETTSES